MNYLIRLLFILNLYTFFISDIFACKCAKPDSYGSVGTYCGGELQMHGGGDDCGWDILWKCYGLGSTAKLISLCGYGCCGNNFDYSKCCIGNGCFNKCDETYLPKSAKSVTTNPISSTTSSPNNPENTSKPPNLPESQPVQSTSVSTTSSSPDTSSAQPFIATESIAAIVASVIGGVSAIIAAIIGVKCNRNRKKENL